jgi:hypothetical protein
LEKEQIEKVRANENGTLDSVTFKRYMTLAEVRNLRQKLDIV